MKQKIILALTILITLLNCQKKDDNNPIANGTVVKSDSTINPKDSMGSPEITSVNPQPYTKEFLKIEDAEINGHKIILSQNKFDKIYPKKDSVKTDLWECGSPFEWLDEDWMTKTYGKRNSDSGTFERFDGKITSMYTNNAEFNSNKHIVLFNSANAQKNSFQIKSHHILLNQDTTIEEFQKLFPKLENETTDQKNVSRFRISVDKNIDDAFLFYFKDGKLDKFVLWWLLC